MWYTDEEILYDVAHALNPYQQIRVLAELNDVSVARIEKVLRKHNVPLPEYQRQSRTNQEYAESRELTAEQAKRREKKRQWYKENRAKILARKDAYRRRRRERENGEE